MIKSITVIPDVKQSKVYTYSEVLKRNGLYILDPDDDQTENSDFKDGVFISSEGNFDYIEDKGFKVYKAANYDLIDYKYVECYWDVEVKFESLKNRPAIVTKVKYVKKEESEKIYSWYEIKNMTGTFQSMFDENRYFICDTRKEEIIYINSKEMRVDTEMSAWHNETFRKFEGTIKVEF